MSDPQPQPRNIDVSLVITVTAREGETDAEVRRWLVNQVYEIADVDEVTVDYS